MRARVHYSHFAGDDDFRIVIQMRQRLGFQLAFEQRFTQLVGYHLGQEDRDKIGNSKRYVAGHFHLQRRHSNKDFTFAEQLATSQLGFTHGTSKN